MNAESNFFIIVIIATAFFVGKQCANIGGVGAEAIEHYKDTRAFAEAVERVDGEIEFVSTELGKYKAGQVAVGYNGGSSWVACGCNDGNCNQGGVKMRGGIFTILIELVKKTPTIVEFLIISLIVFLIARLIKKSYPDLFNREIVSGVKVKFLIPVGITLFGCLFYCFLAKEPFLLALADGGMLALMGIVWDNSWEAIKNLFKSIFGAIKR